MTQTIEGAVCAVRCGIVFRVSRSPAPHASAALAERRLQPRSCRGYISMQRISRSLRASRFKSSPSVTRTFCGHCGTPLTYWTTNYEPTIDVTTGSLDDQEAFLPIVHVWTSHKLSWVRLSDGLPCFEGGPPSE